MGKRIFYEKNNKQEVGEDFKRFRSESRICSECPSLELAQNVQAIHQTNFGKVRHAKLIKSTQVYDKWYQKRKKLNFAAFRPHALGP